MPNEGFYKEVDDVFESHLKDGQTSRIRIKDLKTGNILEDMDYNLVVFDDKLNIYKVKNGGLKPVDNTNFKAVIIEE
jgi:hypothetical protein